VITRLEPELFLTVAGLTVQDFHLLVRLKVFNTEQMNAAVFAFRRYEDASLRYTGIESHPGLTHVGLYDTVVAKVWPLDLQALCHLAINFHRFCVSVTPPTAELACQSGSFASNLCLQPLFHLRYQLFIL